MLTKASIRVQRAYVSLLIEKLKRGKRGMIASSDETYPTKVTLRETHCSIRSWVEDKKGEIHGKYQIGQLKRLQKGQECLRHLYQVRRYFASK